MPTILRYDGYRFFFYSNDHLPIHIHVEKGSSVLKFNITPIELVKNYNFNNKEIRQIRSIIESNQDFIIKKWNEYFDN